VKTSDAVIALDLKTGAIRWSRQLTAGDIFNFGCSGPPDPRCGPDADIGASPIIVRGSKSRLLLVGQKSGVVHALDPDEQGRPIWETAVGQGGRLGGIEWGIATDERKIYVPLSDFTRKQPARGGGLFALALEDGSEVWHTPAPKPTCLKLYGCSAAQSAAVAATPSVVFSGSLDGHLRAYRTSDGKIIWDFDTLKDFKTVNGVPGRGGSLNGGGPTLADGMVFVASGYGRVYGRPGNVILAFSSE
jgi:polyvinyl alcohol dehydrogenase (cytochrome)